MKGLFKTRILAALLLFSVAGAFSAAFEFGKQRPENFPFMSWTGWTINDFLKQEKCPELVFLGSSLVLVPLDGVDADYLNRRVDGSQHHHSAFFEKKLSEKTGINFKSFNFALPGEMPSDAYLIVNNLFKGNKTPNLIVYGVGPRDFLDNMLPSPSATDPYRYVSRFDDQSKTADLAMPELFDRLNFELGKLSYFYGAREDLSAVALRTLDSFINSALPLPAQTSALSFDDRHHLLPDFRPCEMLKGQAWFRPSTAADHAVFVDNLAEYKKRYAKMKWDTYICQMRFFANMIDRANERGIKVVIVTMPITELNRSLLSPLAWNAYRSGVIGMAKRKGATVVDFSNSNEFTQADFGDTVHLHSGGGKKLLELLSERLSMDSAFCASLQQSQIKKQIAETGGRL